MAADRDLISSLLISGGGSMAQGVVVVQMVGSRTYDQEVVGSTSGLAMLRNNLRQVLHALPLSPNSI